MEPAELVDGLVRTPAYRLHVRPDRPTAMLEDGAGEPWLELRLLASADTINGLDETVSVSGPEAARDGPGVRLTWRLGSSRWSAKRLVLDCLPEMLRLRLDVEGEGRLSDVSLAGGRAALANGATGRFLSGARFATVFNPAPGDPGRLVLPATEATEISASGGSEAGRGQWFFTPAPLWYAVNRAAPGVPDRIPDGPWLTFGLEARGEERSFVGFGYQAQDRGFAFTLPYEGHTEVRGAWTSPDLVIAPASDVWAGLAAYRERLEARGLAPGPPSRQRPDWWREPMFCGWGAQCAVAAEHGEPMSAAPRYARQERYDEWLDHLEARGIVPGTIVLDDKWQTAYGTSAPDPAKWPDLPAWIAARHARGQRVLLWWKAWDAEGLPAEACVTTPDGRPIAMDPEQPAGRAAIQAAVRGMLGRDGLNADGLKIDFTARTPSGSSLRHHGPSWGIGLLDRLLETVREAATEANPAALLIGHAPEPWTARSLDMIRLNDMLRLDDPPPRPPIVGQMLNRARTVAAACPGHLIDTDDWCAPNLAQWRAWTAVKPAVGVPALYYATHLDLTGERLEDEDYALLRRTWAEHRDRHGLPER